MNEHPYNPRFKQGYAVVESDMYGTIRIIKVYNTSYRAQKYKDSLGSASGIKFCVL
jgi:hypothetical protein